MRLLSACIVAAAALFAVPALACPGEMAAAETKSFEYVSLDDFKAWHAEGKVTVIDANKAETFAKNHVPGAVHMRYDAMKAAALPQAKDAKLVFYCYNESCKASHKAAMAAIEMGYTQVYVYAGGIEGWMKAGLKVAKADAKKGDA
ncbi:MAG: rhodanese-like domain-containing protein [Myxococcales bacterium]|nr:rhodanese-like domain-containing protein [Myxococcales bacterium]